MVDGAAVAAALVFSGLLAGGDATAQGTTLLPFAFLVAAGAHGLLNTYGANLLRRSYMRAFAAGIVTAALVGVMGLFYSLFRLRIEQLALMAVLAGTGFVVGRLVIDLVIRAIYMSGRGHRATLFIGAREDMDRLVTRMRRSKERRSRVIGHLTPRRSADPNALGSIETLPFMIQKHDVENVIISAHLKPDNLEDVIYECFARGVQVSLVPRTLSELPCRVSGHTILGWPLVELAVPRLQLLQVVLKRLFDLVLSVLGLVVLAPVLAVVALAIKLESRGPVLFRQERLGLEGRPFDILKFRTMRPDAEELLRSDEDLRRDYVRNDFKLPPERDPRVTRVGAFLRRWSLDELPQLVNVLRGDMSLVGPRPVVAAEIDHYGEAAPVFLGVKPGVTGHWQVSGRSEVAYPRRAELDLEYIRNWSLGSDLMIILRTIPVLLSREGAH